MKFFSVIVGAVFLCSVVYAEAGMNMMECSSNLYKEIFLKAFNSSGLKEKLEICCQSGSNLDDCILDMVQSDADLNTIRMNLMSGETRDKIIEKCEFDLWPMSVQTFNNLVLVWVGKMLN